MVDINLLPWRTYQASCESKKLKRMLLIVIIFIILITLLIYLMFLNYEEKLTDKLNVLSQTLQTHLSVDQPTSNIPSIPTQLIKDDQIFLNQLFLQLTYQEKNIHFTEITKKNNTILFTGYTRTAADLTRFLLSWPAIKLFYKIELINLQNQQKSTSLYFKFLAQKNFLEKTNKN